MTHGQTGGRIPHGMSPPCRIWLVMRLPLSCVVLAGRIAGNYMIDLTGSNAKLRARAIRIVMDLANLDEPEARRRLEAANWSVRAALQASGHQAKAGRPRQGP